MFKVDDFSPLLSATHYSISVSCELHVYHNVTDDASLSETTRIKRWNGNCSQTFASNLYTEAIDVILSSMPEVYIVDKDSINKINNDIAAVIFEAAEKKYGTSKRTKKVNKFDQKPWFDNECKNARKYYHRCRKKYNMVKTIENKNDMSTASKQYKKVIKQNLLK